MQQQQSTLLRIPQHLEMQRGMIYVIRRISGLDVPLRIDKQSSYREWVGCFSAI